MIPWNFYEFKSIIQFLFNRLKRSKLMTKNVQIFSRHFLDESINPAKTKITIIFPIFYDEIN